MNDQLSHETYVRLCKLGVELAPVFLTYPFLSEVLEWVRDNLIFSKRMAFLKNLQTEVRDRTGEMISQAYLILYVTAEDAGRALIHLIEDEPLSIKENTFKTEDGRFSYE